MISDCIENGKRRKEEKHFEVYKDGEIQRYCEGQFDKLEDLTDVEAELFDFLNEAAVGHTLMIKRIK